MKIKAIIFDMDGLMFDTERLAQDIWLEYGRRSGYPIDEGLMAKLRGRNSAAIEALCYEALGADFPFKEAKKHCYDGIFDVMKKTGLPVKAGLYELLEHLKEKGVYSIALATSTDRTKAMTYLKNAGVNEYFDHMTCGDMVQESKPSPEIFLKTTEALGLEPASCLVLEDSSNGVIAAARAGCRVIMVPDMDAPSAETAALADAVAASLYEVPQLLHRWNVEDR